MISFMLLERVQISHACVAQVEGECQEVLHSTSPKSSFTNNSSLIFVKKGIYDALNFKDLIRVNILG